MEQRLATLIQDLENADHFSVADLNRAAKRAGWVAEFTLPELDEFFTAVLQLPMPLSVPADRLLASWLVVAVQARRNSSASWASWSKRSSSSKSDPMNSATRRSSSVCESPGVWPWPFPYAMRSR